MPSWSIHLSIAKKVSDKINIKDGKDLFYYGNLIPDVDKNTNIRRYDAHFYGITINKNCLSENIIEIGRFLKTYKNRLNNPLILGYYAHLLTDNYYNNIVYTKCWVQDNNHNVIGIKLNNGRIKKIDIEDRRGLKRKFKHHDFELYGKYIFNDELIISMDYKKIVLNSKYLIPQFLNKKLIKNRLNYLKNRIKKFNKLSLKEQMVKHKYILFTKEELDELLDNCSKFVIEKINNL